MLYHIDVSILEESIQLSMQLPVLSILGEYLQIPPAIQHNLLPSFKYEKSSAAGSKKGRRQNRKKGGGRIEKSTAADMNNLQMKDGYNKEK